MSTCICGLLEPCLRQAPGASIESGEGASRGSSSGAPLSKGILPEALAPSSRVACLRFHRTGGLFPTKPSPGLARQADVVQ